MNKKRDILPFDGQWLKGIGCPELKGVWFFHGDSGNGKTTFVFQLCKYLCQFVKVGYNSIEEGDSLSIRKVMERVGMKDVERSFQFYDQDSIEDTKERLRKRGAPQVIVLDSWQYCEMRVIELKQMEREFPDTLFIIIGHTENNKPMGSGLSVFYHASVKGKITGYKAFIVSRYLSGGAGEPVVIWEEGASKYWAV